MRSQRTLLVFPQPGPKLPPNSTKQSPCFNLSSSIFLPSPPKIADDGSMKPQILKYRLWRQAARRDPQPATYNVRIASATDTGSDTFTSYALLRVVYDPQTQDQFLGGGVGLADQYRTWIIYQVDLDNASAPAPQLTYELVINGNTWIIENVQTSAMDQAFSCRCRLSR